MAERQRNNPAAFYSFYRARQRVRRQRLKVLPARHADQRVLTKLSERDMGVCMHSLLCAAQAGWGTQQRRCRFVRRSKGSG